MSDKTDLRIFEDCYLRLLQLPHNANRALYGQVALASLRDAIAALRGPDSSSEAVQNEFEWKVCNYLKPEYDISLCYKFIPKPIVQEAPE